MIANSSAPVPAEEGAAPCPPPGRIVIVGSRGRMGKMLLRKCEAAGLCARGVDQPYDGLDLDGIFHDASLVIVCVPAKFFARILRIITPHMPPQALLMDITSVKERPIRQMESLWPGPVVGSHPLFGPAPRPDDKLSVVLVRGAGCTDATLALARAFYEKLGCSTFESTAQKHDQAMARIQNMNFITNLAYFAVLAGQEDLLPFLTPSFHRRKNAAAKLLNEDAEMFAGLFEANGYSHEAVRQYRKMLNVAASGDIDLLCKRAQWWWRDEAGSN